MGLGIRTLMSWGPSFGHHRCQLQSSPSPRIATHGLVLSGHIVHGYHLWNVHPLPIAALNSLCSVSFDPLNSSWDSYCFDNCIIRKASARVWIF
jgi:hypothetical protein